MNSEPTPRKPFDHGSWMLPYRKRFFLVVVLPNLLAWLSLAVCIYLSGTMGEFRKIAGPLGPGPGAGNGISGLFALSIFSVGGFMVFAGVLIPVLVLTLVTSGRTFMHGYDALLAGLTSAAAGVVPAVVVYLLFKYNFI